jgi:hypothetical protein
VAREKIKSKQTMFRSLSFVFVFSLSFESHMVASFHVRNRDSSASAAFSSSLTSLVPISDSSLCQLEEGSSSSSSSHDMLSKLDELREDEEVQLRSIEG